MPHRFIIMPLDVLAKGKPFAKYGGKSSPVGRESKASLFQGPNPGQKPPR